MGLVPEINFWLIGLIDNKLRHNASGSGAFDAVCHWMYRYSLTQIAVDWGVYAADRFYYDVLFIGTGRQRSGWNLFIFLGGRDFSSTETLK